MSDQNEVKFERASCMTYAGWQEYAGLHTCQTCGSVVEFDSIDLHRAWHGALAGGEKHADAEHRAIYATLRAWRNPGPNPDYHFRQRAILQRDWPALSNAIRQLSEVSPPAIGRAHE